MAYCRVAIDPYACIVWAFLLLILPLQWMLAFFIAAVVHELCHCAAVWLCGYRPCHVEIGVFGVRMDLPPLSGGQEFFCSLAGPLGGFLLLIFARWYPQLCICGLIQSLYNLIPVYPLDGGRMLYCLCRMICPDAAAVICKGVGILTVAALLLWMIFARMGGMAMVVAGFLTVKILYGKIPCKPPILRVQ